MKICTRKTMLMCSMVLAGAAFATSPVFAQDSGAMQNDSQQMSHDKMQMQHDKMMKGDKMGGPMMGKHTMPATVKSVDHGSGIVTVNSEGMDLKVHFPPSAVANLKAGDHINLNLSYQMSTMSHERM